MKLVKKAIRGYAIVTVFWMFIGACIKWPMLFPITVGILFCLFLTFIILGFSGVFDE